MNRGLTSMNRGLTSMNRGLTSMKRVNQDLVPIPVKPYCMLGLYTDMFAKYNTATLQRPLNTSTSETEGSDALRLPLDKVN